MIDLYRARGRPRRSGWASVGGGTDASDPLALSSVAPIRPGIDAPSILAKLGSRRPGHHGDIDHSSGRSVMDALAAGEHGHERLDPPGAGRGPLGVLDAVEDGVAVAAVERLEEGAAAGSRSSSRARSSGTWAALCGSYAASQRPSARARSTSRRPDGCISPRSIRSSALARLTCDHLLRRARERSAAPSGRRRRTACGRRSSRSRSPPPGPPRGSRTRCRCPCGRSSARRLRSPQAGRRATHARPACSETRASDAASRPRGHGSRKSDRRPAAYPR